MSDKETLIGWILKWVLTSLFGMMWFPGKWLSSFEGVLSGFEGKSGSSLISIRGWGSSLTEVQTTGSVSSYEISSAPGTTVEVRNNQRGSLTPQQVITMILVFFTMYMSVGVYLYIFRPGIFPKSTNRLTLFEKINQGILLVLLIAYLINLIILFIRGYKVNKQAGMHTVANLIFIGIFLALTLVYIFWGMGQLAETRMRLFFPVEYFSAF